MNTQQRDNGLYTSRGISAENRRWLKIHAAVTGQPIGKYLNSLIDHARAQDEAQSEYLGAGSND